jgi:hypothetical protein
MDLAFIQKLEASKQPLFISRENLDHKALMGSVLSASSQLVVVNKISENFLWDGLAVIRLADISTVSWSSSKNHTIEKIGVHYTLPAKIDLDLDGWPALLDSIQKIAPTATFFCEQKPATFCFVASKIGFSENTVNCLRLTMNNQAAQQVAFPVNRLTRIDLLGGKEQYWSNFLAEKKRET